jgi:hypothetical protein
MLEMVDLFRGLVMVVLLIVMTHVVTVLLTMILTHIVTVLLTIIVTHVVTVPDEESTVPVFKTWPQSQSVDEGVPVTFSCSLDSPAALTGG